MLITDATGEEETTSFAGGNVQPGHHRRSSSFSYQLLPSQTLINLSILKLDNSTFDVQVERSATIRELKASIEQLFYSLLKDQGTSISWSHVWSHFCLCFRNQKLTNDKATLRSLGIKDGDQLCFVQHLSMEKESRKRKSKDRNIVELPRSWPSSDMPSEDEIEKCSNPTGLIKKSSSCGDINIYRTASADIISEDARIKFCIFPRGWFSYSKLKGPDE
ncbi:U11/U12 small nuclear ribonucleoprotein 25 kDa protein-like [Carex rostrata]